jgi:phenylacetate-coenzyme A ligase PaaK-like adenylate-forming protein
VDLTALPPLTKPEVMADFAAWLTDPTITRQGIDAFVADPGQVGALFRGRYAVWTTSGTTGTPGLFLHDRKALAVYEALLLARGWPAFLRGRFGPFLQAGGREAVVAATGGHFGAVAFAEGLRRRSRLLAGRIRVCSALAPLPALVAELAAFRPAVLSGYPTALLLLAREQAAGRLALRPALALTGGEWLAPADRAAIAAAFACPVRDLYGATEFHSLALECAHGQLHLNADWAILEPVDEAYRPVPLGQPSRTVLLTNLANRVQPIIRYDLGDSVTLLPGRCPCGTPLPALRVEGRRGDILELRAADGAVVPLLPLALTTVIEEVPGIRRFQATQTGPNALRVRLEPETGADRAVVWAALADHLRCYLGGQGLPEVAVALDPEPPRCDPASGKFRQIWAEPGAARSAHTPPGA